MYGIKIKELRCDRGLSQEELARKVGTSQRNISKYEREQLDLSTESIKSFCDFFEVSADYLLGRSDDFGNVSVQNAAPALSEEETELVRLYRTMSSAQRARFLAYGDGLLGVEYSESAKKRHV